MWLNLKHRELYLLVLGIGLLLSITALGGGLFYQSGPWFSHWQHKAFVGLCHQDPLRSFWINGAPMAVCSRCLGIYTGFALMWIVFPVRTDWLESIAGLGKKIMLAVLLVNVADVVGNNLDFWENTLSSRYLMGSIIGTSAALVLGCGFKGKQQHNQKHHGTVRLQ